MPAETLPRPCNLTQMSRTFCLQGATHRNARLSADPVELRAQVTVQPHEMLFQVGESSKPGIFIVLEGQLGVFLPEGEHLRHTNTLQTGESVGDLDVLDGQWLHFRVLP